MDEHRRSLTAQFCYTAFAFMGSILEHWFCLRWLHCSACFQGVKFCDSALHVGEDKALSVTCAGLASTAMSSDDCAASCGFAASYTLRGNMGTERRAPSPRGLYLGCIWLGLWHWLWLWPLHLPLALALMFALMFDHV